MHFVKYILRISCFLASYLCSLPVLAFLHCLSHYTKGKSICSLSCFFQSSFVSFFSQLTLRLLNPDHNSLVCLAVLILEIIPKKIASQLFLIHLLENTSRMQCTETLWLKCLEYQKILGYSYSKNLRIQYMLDLLQNCCN